MSLRGFAQEFCQILLSLSMVASSANAQAQQSPPNSYRNLTEAKTTFCAVRPERPMNGSATTLVGARSSAIGLSFDRPQTFAEYLPGQQFPGGHTGEPKTTPPDTLHWRRVPFPDGSGSMRLPDGWQYTFAQKGMVSAVGPHGVIERGLSFHGLTRAACARYTAQWGAFGLRCPGIVGDPTDPVSVLYALNSLMNAFSERSGRPQKNIVRVIEVAPIQVPNFPLSGFIDYEFDLGGVRYRSIQLIMVAPVSMDGSWFLYTTYIASPIQSFSQNLPILLEIWKSAQTARGTIDESAKAAMDSLREAGEIWRRSTERREQAEERWHKMRQEEPD